MRQRLAVDMDGVIADLHPEWVRRYNEDYNDNLKPSDITHWNWHDICDPRCGKKLYDYLDSQELFENLPVMKDSQDILYRLSKRYEIFIITSPFNRRNVLPKWNWLEKHFGFISEDNYVFTKNKGIANANWLIDDKPSNFNEFCGVGLLYDAPHNHAENDYKRLFSWKDVGMYFDVI